MFKAIWHEKQILIVLLWSVLLFIGYHVLVQPAYSINTSFLDKDYDWNEFGDDHITKSSVDAGCEASEDYEKNKKACDRAYNELKEQEERAKKSTCKDVGGKWPKIFLFVFIVKN